MVFSRVDALDFNSKETKFGLFFLAALGGLSLAYHLLRYGKFLLDVFVLPGASVGSKASNLLLQTLTA